MTSDRRNLGTLGREFFGSVILCFVASVVLSGCGEASGPPLPKLSKVQGTVKLDGQPLAGASVQFFPTQKGAISHATTDMSGHYELTYGTTKSPGATAGEHLVRISKPGEGSDTMDRVPAKFNSESTLKKIVTEGDNTIDFDLTSK